MYTHQFRAYPSKETQSKLWQHANALNRLYNGFLDEKKTAYETDKTSISRFDQQAKLIDLKEKEPLLKEIHSQVLQQIPLRLDRAYKDFFRRIKKHETEKGFPNFRSCKKFFGILYPQSGYKIQDNLFITKQYGEIKFIKHREILGKIKQVYITCNDNNEWYISITTDCDKEQQILNRAVGLDVGITNIYASSDKEIKPNYNHAKYFDKKINNFKSKRDKVYKKNKRKQSRKYHFYSKMIKKLYGAKNRKINDFLHKVSYGLSRKYDTIFIEKLDLKKMSEGQITGLNRELRNAKIATFINFLKYKVKTVIEVNPRNTSKTCCMCGKIHDMPLNRRVMKCECGNKMNRDINAAKNIYCLGQAILSGVCTVESTIQEALAFRRG